MTDVENLPGGELVSQGIADYAAGRITPESCLVAVGWPRLERSGLPLPAAVRDLFPEPELQLYGLLLQEGGDAYSRYNLLLRRLISFEQSLERANASATTSTAP